MSWDTVQITEFSAALDVKEQQMTSRLLPFVERLSINGDNFAYDGITEVQSYRANTRNPEIQPSSAAFLRRKLSRERVVVTLEVDDRDVRGMLTNPEGKLAELCIAAVERETDRIIYDAMFDTVYTGRNFATSIAYTSDGITSVDATAAFTYEKLLEIRATFMDNEVGVLKNLCDKQLYIVRVFCNQGKKHLVSQNPSKQSLASFQKKQYLRMSSGEENKNIPRIDKNAYPILFHFLNRE